MGRGGRCTLVTPQQTNSSGVAIFFASLVEHNNFSHVMNKKMLLSSRKSEILKLFVIVLIIALNKGVCIELSD